MELPIIDSNTLASGGFWLEAERFPLCVVGLPSCAIVDGAGVVVLSFAWPVADATVSVIFVPVSCDSGDNSEPSKDDANDKMPVLFVELILPRMEFAIDGSVRLEEDKNDDMVFIIVSLTGGPLAVVAVASPPPLWEMLAVVFAASSISGLFGMDNEGKGVVCCCCGNGGVDADDADDDDEDGGWLCPLGKIWMVV